MTEEQIVGRVLADLSESKHDHHNSLMVKVKRRYDAYRGIVERNSEADGWQSKVYPKYAFQIIETIISNLTDDGAMFEIVPRPIVDDPQTIDSYVRGARAMERLLKYELEQDHFARKQRPFTLQQSIVSISPAKGYWVLEEHERNRLVQRHAPIIHPVTGSVMATIPTVREEKGIVVLRDGPTFEPLDVQDFFWPRDALDVQGARYIIHRAWLTMSELRQLETDGVFDNVDALVESQSQEGERDQQVVEDAVFERQKKRGVIEVLEWWGPDGKVAWIGNRKVILRYEETNPFDHGLRPFMVASAMPQPFEIAGVSDIELVAELQEALWFFSNQRMDNVALLNNAIVLIANSLDDQDFEFGPGEFWSVDSPQQVEMWTPNTLPAEVSMQAEAMLKGDIQNITGGMPFMAGTDSSTVDQKTATGASIVTTLAQGRLKAKKTQIAYAYADYATIALGLLQQFVREDRLIPILGRDGVTDYERVSPLQLQGNYVGTVKEISESMMRSERRAEAQALMTVALQAAPFLAAQGQQLNVEEFIRDLLQAFDKTDTDKYFSSAAPPPMDAGGVSGAAGPGGPGGALGVTSPLAYGPQSPSSQVSLSPEVFLQRAMAMRGGGRYT